MGSPSLRAWSPERAHEIVAARAAEPGPLLVSLQALQAEFGYVHPDAVPLVAQELNLSRAEVHGVLTFYHDLRTTPPPRATVRVCAAEACQAVGARALMAHAEAALADDAEIGLEHVYCLGNCALGPSASVDGRTLGRVTPERLDHVIAGLRA